ALTWSINVTTGLEDAYVNYSTDGGASWGNGPTLLDLPMAYGGDTVTSCHITSLFPWYDAQDMFHIVANLMPMINDTGYILPSQIWHYCPDNNPQWSHIATASVYPDNYLYAIGYNATLACRPTIGQDNDGNLYVAWEQFDTLNYEPTTSRARADIWMSGSDDNGLTWGDGIKVTDAGTHSMRFPSVIDMAVDGGSDEDTVYILFEDDSVSGFYVQSEGPATPNPVVVQKIPGTEIPKGGVAEKRAIAPLQLTAVAEPNPFGGRTRISYMLPQAGNVSLVVYDAVGRPVQAIASGRREAGRYTATWDAHEAAAGVYFYTLTSDKASLTKKLILTD
ncbi:T9SS type A sorting domain-containing protein, partial [candidate division WOR-3 bacterium]|nr:T9SS type A sorting domain-containing protein [candidate division WOR-3 bacterium]